MASNRSLKYILEQHRHLWDHDAERPAAREDFRKVLACRTPALGAEVYASESEQKVVYHTCKSRACSSCGRRATVLWQRDQWAMLPDVPYREITFTMPDVLWPIFNHNRALLHDLSAIGAKAIESWVEAEHGVKVCIMVVAHTFGRHLNFNSHLHILVSSGGFRECDSAWKAQLNIRKASLGDFWRDSVIEHLRLALKQGKLISSIGDHGLDQMLIAQGNRRWRTHHKEFGSKYHFLQYAARYLRRPPLAEYRFHHVGDDEIVFRTHDHRLKREVLTSYSPPEFIRALAQQVPERYRHSVRYFGLLAPRTKARFMGAILTILGQARRPRPSRLSWALSIEREFGRDPLLDATGARMRLIARRSAMTISSGNAPVHG